MLIWCLLPLSASAQNISDIKKTEDHLDNVHLRESATVYANRPRDLEFGVTTTAQGDAFFYCNDKDWFEKLIGGSKDALTVDYVFENQFRCGAANTLDSHWLFNGYVLPITYKKDIKYLPGQNEHEFFIHLGRIPSEINAQKYEENLIIISDNILCDYVSFYNLEGHHWQLLETGLFLDTASQLPDYDVSLNTIENITKTKKFTLVVPFEKNKYAYNKEDFEHFFNDNQLNTYQIDSINIKAFASIEGTKSGNEALVKKRAESITQAMQEFQGEKFDYSIVAHENWIEFFHDIKNPKYNDLRDLKRDHETIRREVNTKYSTELEPILKNHRKAIVEVYVTLREKLEKSTPEDVINEFNNALQNDIGKAQELQLAIYSKVQNGQLPENLINQLEIPEGSKYSLLKSNKIIFDVEREASTLLNAVRAYTSLSHEVPGNYKLKYNLVSLRLKLWATGSRAVRKDQIRRDLISLQSTSLHPSLIKRLIVNYNIINTEYLMRARQYQQKDQVVYQTWHKYSNTQFSDANLVNLAKYFVHYNREDWAIQLLIPHVSRLDVSEDLLFYFINLTITNTKLTAKSAYTPLLLNAQNQNPQRFCRLFNTIREGGVTMQLLQSNALKQMKCKYCE